jgi:transcriptional regulator with XRE-family HTH domain
MKYKAGERLRFLRELMGLTREQFANTIGIDFIRLRNMEQKRCRVGEDEFAKIGLLFPEIIPWIIFEGDINLELLKVSDQVLLHLVAAKIEAGQFPKGAEFEEKIKYPKKRIKRLYLSKN